MDIEKIQESADCCITPGCGDEIDSEWQRRVVGTQICARCAKRNIDMDEEER